MQEVRHLTNDISHEVRKEAVAKAYISDLINRIDRNLDRNLNIKDYGTIIRHAILTGKIFEGL
jgi:hypothetical protein